MSTADVAEFQYDSAFSATNTNSSSGHVAMQLIYGVSDTVAKTRPFLHRTTSSILLHIYIYIYEPAFFFFLTFILQPTTLLFTPLPTTMNNSNTSFVRIAPRGNLPQFKCEVCRRSHDASYGSGRFCSSKCARAMGGKATKRNRLMREAAEKQKSQKSTVATKRSSKMSVSSLLN